MKVSNKIKLANKAKKHSSRQDDDDEEEGAGGLKKEGWLRLASVHFASTEHHPPIPLGEDSEGEDKEYKIDVIFGNKRFNSDGEEESDECAGDEGDFSEVDMSAVFRKNEDYGEEDNEGDEVPAPDAFWFRLSDNNLYYASNDVSMVVLGAIAIKNIHAAENSQLDSERCFEILNQESDEWSLCVIEEEDQDDWICAINTAIGESCDESGEDGEEGDDEGGDEERMRHHKRQDEEDEDDEEDDDEDDDDEDEDDEDGDDEDEDDEDDEDDGDAEPSIRLIEQPIIMMPIPSPFCNEKWNYNKKGDNWNCKCEESVSQSPINLRSTEGATVETDKRVDFTFFDINSCDLAFFYEDNMLKLKCGLESEEECEKVVFAKLIDLDFTEYAAREIRFHTPSEHTFDGEKFDMEVQVIFTGYTQGDIKKKAGLAFWVEMIPGSRNQFLDLIDPLMLPNYQEKKVQFRSSNTNQHKSQINVQDLFRTWEDDVWPGFFSYYEYSGSLTSPPCEEYTEWFVVKQSIEFGFSGLQMIKKVLEKQAGPTIQGACDEEEPEPVVQNFENARNIQPINKRQVLFYDAVANGCIIPEKHKEKGHFERLESVVHKYIYVDNDRPTGIDGSYVVSEDEATHGKGGDAVTFHEIGTTAPGYKKDQ